MKKSIRKMLRRIAWTLAVAASLGLSAWAAAQDPSSLGGNSGPEALVSERFLPPAQDYSRQTEMKVELAWWANPATFVDSLHVRIVGSALEVSGTVSNEAAHQQALKIAREESSMRVIDNVKVHRKMEFPTVTKPTSLLHHQATDALHKAMPHGDGGITVDIWTKGQLVVKGTVATLEDKWLASDTLRRLGGCGCVINQLTVLEVSTVTRERETPPVVRPAVAGVIVLPGDPPKKQTSSEVATAGYVLQEQPPPLANSSSVPPSPATVASAPPSASAPAAPPAKTTKPTPVVRGMPYQTKWRRLGTPDEPTPTPTLKGEKTTMPAQAAQATPRPDLAPATAKPTSPAPLISPPVKPTITKIDTPAASLKTPEPVRGSASATPTRSVSEAPRPKPSEGLRVSEPVAPTRSVSEAPRPKPPERLQVSENTVRSVPANTMTQVPHVASSTVKTVPAIQKVEHTTPMPSTTTLTVATTPAKASLPGKATLPAPGSSYVTSGVVLFDTTEVSIQAPVKHIKAPANTRLQERIAAVCGRAVRDVEVTQLSEKELLVRVKARTAGEGEQLSSKIFQMPELDPYKVSLDIPLAP
jgi:hypothetical protein